MTASNSPSQCRFCNSELKYVFVDVGMSPLSNRFISSDELNKAETFYPLKTWICDQCLLVQLEEFESPAEIFQDYVYFSSYSESWLQHCSDYVDSISERLALNSGSQVIELASNDGYLLQYFKARDIPALGIEPALNVAAVAREKGIDTIDEFFGKALASRLCEEVGKADLLLGNNVLAHVPALNDFVAGMKILLKESGSITMEFPHLLKLMEQCQFDTIYHEHFSYFSFLAVRRIFSAHGLKVYDVEQLPTHGGSLRIYACHEENNELPIQETVGQLQASEEAAGLAELDTYLHFTDKVLHCKASLLRLLLEKQEQGCKVVAYGAPAKGNTLLNYCGIRQDLLAYTVDRNPHKQGSFLPGVHIPVYEPERIMEDKPDFVLILPWNLQQEITAQMAAIRDWGGQFIVPIPEARII